MDGQGGGRGTAEGEGGVAAELAARLAEAGTGRLAEAVRLIAAHAYEVFETLRPSAEELDVLVQFLTEVGYATDARRQEWVLLADVLGLSDAAMDRSAEADPRVTPATLTGPFYRADAPDRAQGADLCLDGAGVPLAVTVRLCGPDGQALPGALLEVWHANGAGRYENQDPDNQPEHNLRGRFRADAAGVVRFRTIRPGGYALPDDGPVGRLARRLGLSLDRPAHLHFAALAPGHRRLVTAIFDGSDPAIGRDALFAVRPRLIGTFRPDGPGLALDAELVLAADPPPPPFQEG
jgi:protocatechuate 3,4-dioxygenase beta subunit